MMTKGKENTMKQPNPDSKRQKRKARAKNIAMPPNKGGRNK